VAYLGFGKGGSQGERQIDPLIVADVVARKRCAESLAFDIVKRMRYDALPLSSPLAND